MSHLTRTPARTFAPALLLLLAACAPVTGGNNGDPREDADRPDGRTSRVSGHVAGAAAAEATTVQAWSYDDEGSATLVGEASVEADGAYTLEVPAESRGIVVEAQGEGGAALASVLVVETGAEDETVTAAPIDAETTLEVAVYAALIGEGSAVEDIDLVDLRARLDARTAAVVSASSGSAELVAALAAGVEAAQDTEAAAYGEMGLSFDASAAVDASAEAMAAYDAALDAALDGGADGDADAAFALLVEAMMAADASFGADAEASWEAEAQAGLALRLVVDAAADAALDAVATASGRLEASFAASSVVDTAEDSSAEADGSLALDAAAALILDASAATDAEAMAGAWATFRAALVGPDEADETLLDALLGADASAQAATDLALSAALTAAASFDADMAAAASVAASGGESEAVAEAVTSSWASFAAAVRAGVAASDADGAQGEAAADLVLIAVGGFRTGS